MAVVTTEKYKRQFDIIPEFNVGTTVIAKSMLGINASFWVTLGTVWVDMLGRADLTMANGLKCTAGTVIDFNAPNNITFISDGTGGKVQIVRWEE